MQRTAWAVCCGMAWATAAAGCASPFAADTSRSLRQRVIADAQAHVGEAGTPGAAELAPIYSPDKTRQLDELTAPQRHRDSVVAVGMGLDGSEPTLVKLTLQQAINSALAHNLDLRDARLVPRARATTIVEAEAAFDWTLFASGNAGRTDRPQPASALNGVAVGADRSVQDTASLIAGLRRRTPIGGTIELSTGADYINDRTPRLAFLPDPSWQTNLQVVLTQPLLRDFGPDVNGARIELARNATARDTYALQQRLIEVIGQTEGAYWQVVFARNRLAIAQELLDETIRTRDELVARKQVDVNPVQVAQAEREVNLRRAEVSRARTELRDRSDELKRLIRAPELPLVGEAVVDPTDYPDEVPVYPTLRQAVATAIGSRPDLSALLYDIDDAQVRRRVAVNQRLPRLDLTGEVRHHGLADSADESYETLDEDFTEWLVGLAFEQPIGNRAGHAALERTRIETQIQSLRFQSAAADAVLEVKRAMRAMTMAHELAQLARRTRRAAAENLRALREREKTGQDLTPEFLLDLKLRTQQRLADAETQELRAAVDFALAQVQYYVATGELLAVRGIEIERRDNDGNGTNGD